MAYQPPHRRVGAESSKSVAPPPPPPDPRRRDNQPRTSRRQSFNLNISWCPDAISLWFAVDSHGASVSENTSLQCIPFRKQSYGHLQNANLCTIATAEGLEQDFGAVGISQNNVGEEIVKSLSDELRRSIQRFPNYNADNVSPKMVVRLGRCLFYKNGYNAHMPEIIKLGDLKRAFQDKHSLDFVRKAFESDISEDLLRPIRDRVFPQNTSIEERERFLIRLEDKRNPEVVYNLICQQCKDKEEKIVLKKIKRQPVRHFIADISCLGKSLDLRIMLSSQELLTECPDEDQKSFDKIVTSASIRNDAKGGLHWQLGDDFCGRFKVIGAWHRTITIINCRKCSLKFQRANRFETEATTGRVTWEAKFISKELKRMLEENSVEDHIMKLLENNLGWIWDII